MPAAVKRPEKKKNEEVLRFSTLGVTVNTQIKNWGAFKIICGSMGGKNKQRTKGNVRVSTNVCTLTSR